MARKVCLKVELEITITIDEDMLISEALETLGLNSHYDSEVDIVDYEFISDYEILDSKLV